MTNRILEANDAAWREYDLTQAIEPNRETFDNGWDAALNFAKPLLVVLEQRLRLDHHAGTLDEGGQDAYKAVMHVLETIGA